METHNSDWSSTVLDVDPRAMDGLDKLRHLSLASNNLWSLPKEFFCQMPNLRAANLSRNHLLEAGDAALSRAGGGCQTRLASVDLSFNQLTTLVKGELAQAAATLEELDVSNNRLSILGKSSLESR